jgi:phosphoribosylaminoimidazole-succinocarboxamide synthase
MADWFIDTKRASNTALTAFTLLDTFLQSKGIELVDICFMIDQKGDMIFSEVSQDCMRVRSAEGSLDKDIWRHGGSSELVLQKWKRFNELIGDER